MIDRLIPMAIVGALVTGCYNWSIDPPPDADGDGDGDADGDVCECSDGTCCDGCNFLGIETRCDNEPLSAEYRCASGECGADPMRRGIFRHCSGVSEACPTDMLREGDWEVFQECSDDQVCVFTEGAPLCHSCAEGCSDGHCNEQQCDSGPCCDEGHFANSTTGCGEAPETEGCRCSSGECGADVECRSQHRLCTGMSAECTGEVLEWEDWTVAAECSADQLCEASSGECQNCDGGCESGECVTCSTTSDGECPSSCDVENDIDCCEEAECSAVSDGCCPSSCGVGEDGDCERGELTWVEASTDARPSKRFSHALSYDSDRGVTVLFGGLGPGELLNTWEWSGAFWTAYSPASSASPRNRHEMAYDSIRGVTVLFGGRDFDGSTINLDDTWEWAGTDWVEQTPGRSPSERSDNAMVFDRDRGVIVLFGGLYYDGDSTSYNDTWEWDGTNWVEQTPAASPPERHSHAMAFDSDRGVAVLFGGQGLSDRLNDTWEWDGTHWVERTPATTPPVRRTHAMAYDSARSAAILFGGSGARATLDDTWEWDGTDWVELSPGASPPSRVDHAMAYDSARGVTVLFGGFGASGHYNDTWELGLW